MKKPILQLYGRRLTRPLRNDKHTLYEKRLTDLKGPLGKSEFWKIEKPLHLEIGFGAGEHLAQKAIANPHIQFIGAEPFVNGVASLIQHIEKNNIENIWIWDGNIHDLLSRVTEHHIFDAIYLLFADPWPKKRHFKRRFIQKESIETVHRLLKNEGSWFVATDHADYRLWALKNFENNQHLFSQLRSDIYQRPDVSSWPKTRYEEKAIKAHRSISYMIYKKI
jgi:tRNA (guanine-N7-)-methyltransferase